MTPKEHLKELLVVTSALMTYKYLAGQKKHGGNLFEMTPLELIDEAVMECIDQLTYLLTARAQLGEKNMKFKTREK